MPTAVFQLIRQAIVARKPMSCTYNGKHREFCPHILGHKAGREAALVFQFAGETSSRLPPGGEWRCLSLAEVDDLAITDGRWHTGAYHRTTQSCVDTIDVDVNVPETVHQRG